MKKHVKKAFLAGGVLCALCGAMALAIVGADYLTRGKIEASNLEKEKAGLVRIYGENATYGEAVSLKEEAFPSLEKYWTVKMDGKEIGRVYRGSGKNGYGGVTLLFGIDASFALGLVVTIENTESYGATLKEGYLDPLNGAEDKDAAVDAVKCGATYGAKLCRSILLDGKNHYQKGGAK